jgi:hypothetical protein
MNKFQFTIRVLAMAMFTLAFASMAPAQNTRSYVSGTGNDADPCTRTWPCKSFSSAISKTAEGGEIDVLDPSGYGTVSITKALTIDGGTGSGWASVQASGVSGIIVNVTTGSHANDAVVILRNIAFTGINQTPNAPGTNGISYTRAAHLRVENCQFQNFNQTGISVNLGTTPGVLTVQDCVFDNVNTAVLSNATAPGFSVIHFEHSRVEGSSNGLNANTSTFATVRDSYLGFLAGANGAVRAAAGCEVNVVNSMLVNSNIGANVAGGTIRLTNNSFFNNTTAISGTAQSANNNTFRGNASDGTTTNVIVVK